MWPEMLEALSATGWPTTRCSSRRRAADRLPRDRGLRGGARRHGGDRRQRAGRPRWPSSSCRRCAASRRSSTLTDYAAIDLGATSGRVVRGSFDGGRMALEEVHRFPNRPVRLPDGLHWNLLTSSPRLSTGCAGSTSPCGVGVDTWGVDYALLDGGAACSACRSTTATRAPGHDRARVRRVPAAERYAVTGIQTMPINTVFQLLADSGGRRRRSGSRSSRTCSRTGCAASSPTRSPTPRPPGCSTRGPATWARELIERLGLPAAPFAGDLVEAGTTLGPVCSHHGIGAPVTPWRATTRPRRSWRRRSATRTRRSCPGTWSLLGLELDAPVLTDRAREASTSPTSAGSTARSAAKQRDGVVAAPGVPPLGRLLRRAARPAERARADVPLFDPDDDASCAGGHARPIAAACTEAGQPAPEAAARSSAPRSPRSPASTGWCSSASRLVTGRAIEVIHVIGGARGTTCSAA